MPPKASKGEYIETDTGNKISRRSLIHGTQHIILGGKTVIQSDAVIRGDLYRISSSQQQQQQQHKPTASTSTSTSTTSTTSASPNPSVAITIGRYSYISRQAILRPPSRLHRGVYSFYPLKIGDHVFVGERAVVEAASVGNHVQIGRDAVVGSMAIIKDFACVLDGAVVAPGMVVPSWCVVGGAPARIVGEVGEGYGVEGAEGGMARERYRVVGR
ncbi:dynactin subunit 5 [Aspergillus saccharolyticus JOP 1030-1]|uniref:Dynactin subunit 5 n=1 Tax=Aspergillus saccharolyticus JOP 1030-1 TaxID=1450539 RepID=A0A318ZM15_9EURO|nr:dynactin Arp1 p25 subunit [Aspergillus saccharolyticus JOP 1030-1]PYH45493.1 dynactin Arp1 p25 subunit [Aspergillus saccharolyticus JOP 1030-1]